MGLAYTVKFYVVNWIRGMLSKSDMGIDGERGTTLCNYGELAERLLSPHGETTGMTKPFTNPKPGERATCTCEKGKAPKPPTNPEVVSGSSSGDKSGEEDEMETEAQSGGQVQQLLHPPLSSCS